MLPLVMFTSFCMCPQPMKKGNDLSKLPLRKTLNFSLYSYKLNQNCKITCMRMCNMSMRMSECLKFEPFCT